MKLVVGIPSRGRPLDLIAAVLSLHKLESRANQVEYLVACDIDDTPTWEAVDRIASTRDIDLKPVAGDRPLGLGELHNMLAAETPPEVTFMLWSDRVVPITHQWDVHIANAVMLHPNRVLWCDSKDLLGPGQFILPPTWRAAQGDPCPGLFPFWFEDSALEEIDHYVHGWPRFRVASECAGPRVQRTNRMRDLPFWITFYASLRPQRIEDARRIARTLGVPFNEAGAVELTKHWENRDVDFMRRADELTGRFSAEGPPDESYLAAKLRAEEMMIGIRPGMPSIDVQEAAE